MNTFNPHSIGEENLGVVGDGGFYDLREGVVGNPYVVEFFNPAGGRDRETLDFITVVAGEVNEAVDVAYTVLERNGGEFNCDTEVEHRQISWTDLMGAKLRATSDSDNAATLYEEKLANARLMAAAPALLSTLLHLLPNLQNHEMNDDVRAVMQAIGLALGNKK